MSRPTDGFGEYLAPDESVVASANGSVVGDSYPSTGRIGLTDRRVLFVSADGRFLEVAVDAICSIRSHPRTRLTRSGLGYRIAALVGALVAASAFLGAMVLWPSVPAFLLVLLSLGGVVAAEAVRRSGLDVDRDGVRALREALRDGDRGIAGTLADVELLRRPGDAGERDNDALVLAIGMVSPFALLGLVVLTGSPLAVPLVVLLVGGVASAEYAYRRARRLDSTGRGSRRLRDVTIHLVDGQRVDLRVRDAERIDRELSAVARVAPGSEANSRPSRAGASAPRGAR